MKKTIQMMVRLFILLGAIVLSTSIFAADLQVSGITGTYAAANGVYHLQSGTKNGYSYWVHSGGVYNIHYALYNDGSAGGSDYPYWYIDNDYVDDNGLYYSENAETPTSPLLVTSWIIDPVMTPNAQGSVTVSEYSTIPEINLMGNGVSIVSGDITPSFTDYTKFASTDVSGGISTRTYTIQNTGTVDALSVGAITISGANGSDFTVTVSPASTVNQSGVTTFTITFNPSSSGEKTAKVSIVNNDSNENPYEFTISGYGYTTKNLVISGITSPSAANGTYTHQGVINNFQYWKHSTLDYYIYYSLSASEWLISSSTTGGTSYFFNFTDAYSPTGLTYTNLSSTGTVAVNEEIAVPEINIKVGAYSISDGSVTTQYYRNTNFGSLEVASGTQAKSYIIENTGNAKLSLSGASPYVTITGANASDFTVTTVPSNSILASGTTTLGITFNPSATGTRTATVTILSNDNDEAEYTFAIQGEGVNPRNLKVSNITTPSAANGTYIYQGLLNEFQYWKHSTENYYIYNSKLNGIDPVWYIDGNLSADLYTTSSYNFYSQTDYVTPVSVSSWTSSSGNSGIPTIQYTESEINVTGNSININSGDTSPSLYDYTDLGWVVSGSISKTFTIQNTGIGILNLTGSSPYISLSGANASQFSITSAPSASIAPGGSTSFVLTFTPSSSSLGARTATLSIANDDSNENPYTFLVQSGVGILPTITTQATTNIGSSNAVCNGNITTLGSPNPTSYGICYGITANPDVNGSKVDKGTASATGVFTAQITKLTAGTTYHARAYATNNVGTSYGTDITFTTTSTMTEPGNALAFDGTNDYVSVPFATTSLNAFTLETWINPATIPASGDIAILNTNAWDATNGGIHFQFENGYVKLAVYELGSDWPAMSTKLATNKWQHIAVTYDVTSNQVCFYLNGILNNSISKTLSATKISAAEIGAWTSSRYFNGKLDEFRIWNIVRSQADIQADMNNKINASTSGLIGYYNFNEGIAEGTNTAGSFILPDLSSNANNGTLNNFALTGTTSNWVESYAMVMPIPTAATSTSTSGFTANWTAPITGTVNNYLLEVASDAAFTSLISGYNPKTVASTSTSSLVTGLTPNVTYFYRVRADKTSLTGQGDYSNSITAQTLPQAATVTTQDVTNINITTATGNGNITNLGVPNPTAYGVCWSTSSNPTTSDSKIDKGAVSATGTYTASISGLSGNTTYYVRAFATNTAGTSYGTQVTFTTDVLTTTWNGSAWSPSTPTAQDDAIINGNYNSTGFNCNNLTINAGKQVTIASGTLAVSGNLLLKSDANGTATIIDNGTITVGGSTKVEQFVKTFKNTYISSPVSSAMSGCILLNGSSLMWNFNESTISWNLISNYVTSLDIMKGYIISPSSVLDTTISFTGGSLNTGTQTISGLSRTGNTNTKRGFNLIGNPYPSCVNWKQAVDDKLTSNLDPTIWYRSKNGTAYVFDTYNAFDNVGTNNYGGTNVTGNIPPMQAVWVRVNADNVEGSVTFNNSMRSHPTTDNKLKADANTNDIVRLQVASGNSSDETILVFNANASNAYDAYDSQKMFAESADVPQIYSTADAEKVVINGLESVATNNSIPLGFKTAKAGTFTITATEINGVDAVVLEDKLLNKTQDLTGSSSYTFTSDNVDNASRFTIRLKANSVTDVPDILKSTIAIAAQNRSIVVTTSETSGTITVYDLLGRIVETKAIEGTKTILESSAGVYFVKVQTATNSETKKIIIE